MLHRRDAMIRLGQLGLGASTLPALLSTEKAAAATTSRPRKAKSCIYIFLWGGPPQQDMWDMKPDAPQGIRSLFRPIRTKVSGIDICDQMPLLARHTDKIALVRSLTHPSNIHEASVYHMLTGKQNPTLISPRNMRKRSDFPHFGSVLSSFARPGALPASVTLPRPIGHDGVTYAGTYAGFLGPRHDPMELQVAPMSSEQPAHALQAPTGVDASRMIARKGLLHLIEKQDRFLQAKKETDALTGFQEQAFRMVSSSRAKRAFNLDLESPRLRDRYGRNEYGESFLLARRLVEGGVRLVSVIWMYFLPSGRIANVWDNHGGGSVADFGSANGTEMLKQKYCLPPLDRAYSALLEDLSDRGLLDETLVVTVGEFGRTPRLNSSVGRDHWGPCQTALLAGGGIRGGQVYGSSDKIAAYPKDSPVSPEDFLATIHHAFGHTPETEIRDRENRPHRITDGQPITPLFA